LLNDTRTKLKIGKFDVKSLDTGLFALDGGAMFGVIPKNLWSKKYNQGDEFNRIPLASRPLVITFDDRKILVDSGNGTKYDEKFVEMYNIDIAKSEIRNTLTQSTGIKSDEITDVILTHLHFDHCGGSTEIVNGLAQPVFGNAKHYVQKKHLEWAKSPSVKDRASFMPENYQPLIDENVLEFTDGEGELFSGISVIPIHGHTSFMQMVKISDGGETLLYCADLAPTTAHLGIAYGMGYDNFPLTTIEEKKKYFTQAAEENWIIFFEHDAFTQAVRIENGPKGFVVKEQVQGF